MRRFLLILPILPLFVLAADPPQEKPSSTILIAFSSFRERKQHPKIYFYEHDGVGNGKIIGAIDAVNQRSDYHASLSRDGKYCAFASELENQTGRIQLWDMKDKKLVELPTINDSPNAQMHPTISADGNLIAFAAWNRAGAGPRWDLLLYDMSAKKMADLPGVNTATFDERMPALSGDGRFLAYVTNVKKGTGLSDIFLFDRKENKIDTLPALNSKGMDVEPTLNDNAGLLAFVSDRPGGSGGRDIYLFDRQAGKLLPLPDLNSTANEQTPHLSSDGRFLVFVSERIGGEGERDIYLYDRQTGKLLPTPGLNSKAEDFDPCLVR